jgi:hypothetical protein
MENKVEINKFTIKTGDFKTSLPLAINRTQKSSMDIGNLSYDINQQDLTNIYRKFHPKIIECTFFKCPWNFHIDLPYSGPQSKPQEIENLNWVVCSLTIME